MSEYDPEKIESEVSEFWKNKRIKKKVRESTEGNEPFFMIDGPPYLNGEPHVGHMQGKVLKDVMLRFKQMQGYDVWDQAGFDTHGLPNELATEEEMGIEDKNEIGDSISAKKFIEKCRERATSAKEEWQSQMEDLAVWQDFDNPYMTYDDDYIESAWWLLKKTDDQGFLYQGRKPIHWCPRCQTSLSGYEVTDEYQEVEDIAVFAKFPLKDREEKLVIWTTTPWTIPANMAVFAHPDYQYAIVETPEEKLIVAEQLVSRVMDKAGVEEKDYEVVRTLSGADLKGLAYETPFLGEIPRQRQMEGEDGVHRIHNSDELVTLEDGTGLVHAATGHGPEDYEETRPLGLPVFSPVDSEGYYTEEAGNLEGKNVLEVDPEIVERLADKGLLLHDEKFVHEYPHCWRCKTELIYRAADQWFIENEEVKQKMLDENRDVDWIPDDKQKRFHDFVSQSPDWCISRQNYWGIPIPIWVCDRCEEYETFGSFDELSRKIGGLPDDFDPHKHVVDEISWECDCGGVYERIPDIFDVWFDSGCAPFASLHYPFEEAPFEDMWPMDFITEASDQIRGWFYSLMFCGILGFNEKPYEKILYQGYVLRADGEKMSKSSGTTISPKDQLDEYGADLPRFYQLRLAPPWEQKNYDESEIENEIYRLFSVYWNTKEFLKTHEKDVKRPEELEVEDRWVLSRINRINDGASGKMEECHYHELAREIEDFVIEDLSRFYVKKVRKRVKEGDKAAIWTLKEVLRKVTLLLAPFSPYITEKVYQELDGEEESVHMESYPECDHMEVNDELEEGMELAREIVNQATKIRDENQYNLRWPARRMVLSTSKSNEKKLEKFEDLIEEMTNVEELEFGEVASELRAEPDYSSLGPKFGENAEKVAQIIEELNHDQVEQVQTAGQIETDRFQIEEDDLEIKTETAEGVESRNFSEGEIFMDLEMTQEIEDKALVAEVIREVQQERKEAHLDVEDRVRLSFSGDTEALAANSDMIRRRVNLAELNFEGDILRHSGEVEFRDRKIKFNFSEPVNTE